MIAMCMRIYRGVNTVKHRGFTLVELLSAMVVMSLVMVLATMSLGQFSRYSDKSGAGFEQRINRYLALDRLGQTLEQMLDYYVVDNVQAPRLYFVGEEQEIRFVTTNSWQHDDRSSISYLVVEEDVDGSEALVLYQRSLTDNVFFVWADAPEQSEMTANIVISGATDIRFEYLGIENIRQLYPSGISDNYRKNLLWKSRFLGKDTGYLPEKIKIEVEWPNGTTWPMIIAIRAFNFSKRGFMLDGAL